MRRRKKRGSRNGFWRACLLFLAGSVLGLNINLFNANYLAGNSLPMPFGYGAAVVLSGSMEPSLRVDDLILVKSADYYEVGDVIVFQEQYSLIVHRLIAAEGDALTTKGDANNTADPPVSLSSIKGKVIGRIPMVGGFLRMLRTPAGILCILAAAVFLMEYSYQRERREDRDKVEQIKREIRRLKEEQADSDGDGQDSPEDEGGGNR